MIKIIFNENGYYIAGENIEKTSKISPAVGVNGQRVFQPIHHTYKVLYLALCEFQKLNTSDDLLVYNDSRIIDEINGYIQPQDSVCEQWVRTLRRHLIPSIRSVVIFRKKASAYINSSIEEAHHRMIVKVNKELIAQKEVDRVKSLKTKKKNGLITSLKERWFKNGIR